MSDQQHMLSAQAARLEERETRCTTDPTHHEKVDDHQRSMRQLVWCAAGEVERQTEEHHEKIDQQQSWERHVQKRRFPAQAEHKTDEQRNEEPKNGEQDVRNAQD